MTAAQAAALVEALRPLVAELVAEAVAKAAPPPSRLISIADFAASRGVSTVTIRRAVADGRLASTKIGRRVLVAADATIAPARGVVADPGKAPGQWLAEVRR